MYNTLIQSIALFFLSTDIKSNIPLNLNPKAIIRDSFRDLVEHMILIRKTF